MTFKCGAGYIHISGGRVTATAASALRCKARAKVAVTIDAQEIERLERERVWLQEKFAAARKAVRHG